ncbi:ATP-binding cassette, subfamily G (WHITE), member 2 [Enteropsectra breve]|nr:ATP-binding cassette, subfamily G (WHITE), member 2 [Enteropsectra breve]
MAVLNLTIKNVIYKAKNRAAPNDTNYVTLLKNINCTFTSGNIYAIMGPSGSCKTTFLNTLAGFVPSDALTSGSIMYNGKERNELWFNEIGFIEQDDPVIKKLSIYEFIKEQTSYRLAGEIGSILINEKIKETLEMLDISSISGQYLSDVSCEERKTAMLAVELISEPNILIIDYMMSCLNLISITKLITQLKKHAEDKNKIVIFTVKEAVSDVIELLSNLLVMYKGALLYEGPINEAAEAFERMGFKNKSGLSSSDFLYNTLFQAENNDEEIQQLKEALILNKEKENEAVYKAATMNSKGFKCFNCGISLRHVLLNINTMFKNDMRQWPYGIKFLKNWILMAVVFAFFGMIFYDDEKMILSPDYEPKSPLFLAERAYFGFLIISLVLSPVSYFHSSSVHMRKCLKKRNCSIPTIMCSALLYNAPYFSLGFILSLAVGCINYIIRGIKLEIDSSELFYFTIYALIPPIILLFFSTFARNFYISILSKCIQLYMIVFHGYSRFVHTIFFKPVQNIDSDSSWHHILFDYAYRVLDKGLLSLVSPFKHIAISQINSSLDSLQASTPRLNELSNIFSSIFSQEDVVESSSIADKNTRNQQVMKALNFIYARMNKMTKWPKFYFHDSLVEEVEEAKDIKEFYFLLRKYAMRKLLYLNLSKITAFIYLWVLMGCLVSGSAFILWKRFAPEVRLKL